MSNKTPWMVALAIFITGAAVGVLGLEALRMSHGWPFSLPRPMDMKTAILQHMSRDLGLSAQQKQHIEPLLGEMLEQSRQARLPSMAAEDAVIDIYQAKIREQLTPEQAIKHDAILARIREHRKNMPFPPGGPPPDGPPPPSGFLFFSPPAPPSAGPPPP